MKTIFAQYMSLKKEIERLDRRLKELPRGEVTDYGIDYSTGHGRTIILRGLADDAPGSRLRELLEARRAKAEEMVIQVEKAISECPDARTRNILDAYYVDGKTLLEIAHDLGLDEKTVRREKENYFCKCPQMSGNAENKGLE